jgi:hypothetical protein
LGYELADIDSIGIRAVPGSNVDKPLTDDGVPCSVLWRYPLTSSPQLGDVSEQRSRLSLVLLVRLAYSQRGAGEKGSTRLRLRTVIPIFSAKSFPCNDYVFLRCPKSPSFLVSKTFWIRIGKCNLPSGIM